MFVLWQTHLTPDAANRKEMHNGANYTMEPFSLAYYMSTCRKRAITTALHGGGFSPKPNPSVKLDRRDDGFLSLPIVSRSERNRSRPSHPTSLTDMRSSRTNLPVAAHLASLLRGGCKRKSGRRETSLPCDALCSTSYLIKR